MNFFTYLLIQTQNIRTEKLEKQRKQNSYIRVKCTRREQCLKK